MSPKSQEIEERIVKAFKVINEDLTLKGVAAILQFGAPYSAQKNSHNII